MYTLHFVGGLGSIVLTHVQCTGHEASLLDCSALTPYNVINCEHFEDVGVRCLDGMCIDHYNFVPPLK